MSAQFIGAGSSSARRRRRLLLSADVDDAPPASSASKGRDPVTRDDHREPTRVVTCLNTLIRPQPWVNWLIATCGVALWAAVVFLGWRIDHSGSGLKQVLGLREGKLTRLFAAACLLGATQLSLVTLWYRTHSRKDFHGRYRTWIWTSLIWAILFTAAFSGWHLTASEWAARGLPGRLRPVALQAWPVFAAILVATASRLLAGEMAHTRAIRSLLFVAVAIAGATLVLHLEPGLAPASLKFELQAAGASLWPLLMASTLLHHARFVIHVSNEALPFSTRASRLSPLVQQVWAEVLSLGPSRTSIASSFSPTRLRRAAGAAWGTCRFLVSLVGGLIASRTTRKTESKSPPSRREERRTAAALPTVAVPAESPSKSAGKTSAKSVKSA